MGFAPPVNQLSLITMSGADPLLGVYTDVDLLADRPNFMPP
jgi:hypothetical protein